MNSPDKYGTTSYVEWYDSTDLNLAQTDRTAPVVVAENVCAIRAICRAGVQCNLAADVAEAADIATITCTRRNCDGPALAAAAIRTTFQSAELDAPQVKASRA